MRLQKLILPAVLLALPSCTLGNAVDVYSREAPAERDLNGGRCWANPNGGSRYCN